MSTTITTIRKGYATITVDGEHVGDVERGEWTHNCGGGRLETETFWFAGDVHAFTYGHQSDRMSRCSARGKTRAEAVAAFLYEAGRA